MLTFVDKLKLSKQENFMQVMDIVDVASMWRSLLFLLNLLNWWKIFVWFILSINTFSIEFKNATAVYEDKYHFCNTNYTYYGREDLIYIAQSFPFWQSLPVFFFFSNASNWHFCHFKDSTFIP